MTRGGADKKVGAAAGAECGEAGSGRWSGKRPVETSYRAGRYFGYMKPFLRLFFAALGGGLVAAGVASLLLLQYIDGLGRADTAPYPSDTAPVAAPPVAGTRPPILLTGYPGTERSGYVAPDLKTAARKATAVAVHITARPDKLPVEAVKELFSGRGDGLPDADGEGSGVLYNADGYIVTNNHVVSGAGNIVVRTNNRKSYPATLVGADPKSDLAVIRIEGQKFPYLPLADSDNVEPGAWVLAVGSPLGLTSTVTAGIVSAKGRNISLLPDLDAIESFIQTDAAVNPGNSGGPLVTAEGKLLGINTAIASQTGRFQGYSFAIPSNLVKRIVDDLIEFGTYRRAFLGVGISTLTERDIKRLQLKNRTEGVLVDEILPGGSAEAAGLRVNDLVVKINQRTIRDLPELTELIGRTKVGETLKVTVFRNGRAVELIVPMLAFPE